MVSICFILSTFLYLISFISSTQSVNVDSINRSSDVMPRIESENSDHTRDYLKKINKLTVKTIQSRPAKKNVLRARSLQTSGATNNKKPVSGYAHLELIGGTYYGVGAIMDVWAPHVDNLNDTSESLIRLRIENSAYPDYSWWISVGWQAVTDLESFLRGSVNPKLYGDNATRLTIVWEGPVYKDSQTKHWWLEVNKIAVGYWPSQLFSDNKNDTIATRVQLGGKITTTTTTNSSMPQMGSGYFPKEGYGKAACIQAIQVYSSMDRKDPILEPNFTPVYQKPECYDVDHQLGTKYKKALGNYFFYGGPGGANPK
ncbi:hypothetical protein CASFOL_020927 [Castilleja foliolosa]|uniref:Neprosin PEP catalytic domain-containing protein n=1 Tax=Castilleja foliolosa TaxID=1961234 RepID=A0ABD3D297_9LAMI